MKINTFEQIKTRGIKPQDGTRDRKGRRKSTLNTKRDEVLFKQVATNKKYLWI